MSGSVLLKKKEVLVVLFLFACFLTWHFRVEHALTPDNLVKSFKSLINVEAIASYLKCCWSMTKERNWFAQKFFHEFFHVTFANFVFSHLKHFEYALLLFLFVHSTKVTWSRESVMLHCLRWFFYLFFFLSIFWTSGLSGQISLTRQIKKI